MSDPAWSLVLATPLGAGVLSLQRFEGTEQISVPYLFTLVAGMGATWVDPQGLLGKSIDVTLSGSDGVARIFNGIAARVSQGSSQCVIEMRPWLWLLTLSRNHRIFQNLEVKDILAKVIGDYAGATMRSDLVLSYDKIEYCVQYGESDFDFVSRLLEAAGIAYYFEHKAGTHTLVLVDDPAKFPTCPNAATVPWLALEAGNAWLTDMRVDDVLHEQTVVPAGYKAADYNFTTPATTLLGNVGTGVVYDYPGGFLLKADGDAVSKRRGEELAALASMIRGTSPLRHLASGTTFTLSGHPAASLNAKYALFSVHHHAERRSYTNQFIAFPATVPFRPARVTPRPRIAGSQTAKVVGPDGKEIWTDEYGRIKVQFHWDREGKSDADSSCWVRVSQSWSGKSWGGFMLPRVGQEVVVSFLEGDPDRPLVTGCVYNGDNPVPYALPDNQSRSTIKSQSTPSAAGFNELRFEDKAGEEEIFVQAQKDLNVTVLNSSTETVKQDRTVTVQEGNDAFTVSKGNWTTDVSTGNATHGVKGNSAITIQGNADETVKGNWTRTVDGNGDDTVKGNLTINVTGNVTIKASGSVAIESGTGMTLKGGTSVAIEAGTALTLKGLSVEVTGSASGKFDGGGMLELKGGMVKLN
ncbi:type VI secretion system tip protein VgrG [Sphingomonas sp. R-74633]|uniref:type VI secretion system Vgr family protein n=1 Tax=Sphingomonas sp. R-74633 TaxID=2751188 RepID=UPI0015D18AEF|nr:type VI secretion system tip protein TssI/VgrG [Sphingomonas sp. R-74633]NYT43210.1 type VI secretion system tip protein VgrG [Sphingomonas sp. R-74633]